MDEDDLDLNEELKKLLAQQHPSAQRRDPVERVRVVKVKRTMRERHEAWLRDLWIRGDYTRIKENLYLGFVFPAVLFGLVGIISLIGKWLLNLGDDYRAEAIVIAFGVVLLLVRQIVFAIIKSRVYHYGWRQIPDNDDGSYV